MKVLHDFVLNCCNCAVGRAHRDRVEWVRRKLDSPATFSLPDSVSKRAVVDKRSSLREESVKRNVHDLSEEFAHPKINVLHLPQHFSQLEARNTDDDNAKQQKRKIDCTSFAPNVQTVGGKASSPLDPEEPSLSSIKQTPFFHCTIARLDAAHTFLMAEISGHALTDLSPPWIVLIWSTLHDDGSIFGLPSTQTVLLLSVFFFSFPSRQAFQLERMQKSRIPTTSFRSIVDGYLSTLVSHLQWRGKSSWWRKCSSKTPKYAMIPHRQEYPLRTTVCPLLADRRQACARWACAFAWSKFETMHGGRTDLEGWFRQLCFASRSGCSLQQAGRTWHREMADYARCAWWSIDHDRGARASLAQAKKFLLSQFLFLHLVVVASSLLALSSGSLLLSERMTVLVSFSRQSQAGVHQLLEPFFTGSRSEEEGAEAHGPEDRPSAGRSSFFLLPWNCLQFVLKAFSFSRQALLACCCNTPGIHNKLAGNESDGAHTAVHRPRTRWTKVDEILILGTYLLLDRSFDYPACNLSTPACNASGLQTFHPKLCEASSVVESLTKFGVKRLETRSVTGWCAEIACRIMTRPGSLKNYIWLPSCFAKQQSGHSPVIVWFCFSQKALKKWRKWPPHRNKRPKTKN